jgi:hypothetical protein
MSTFFVFCHVFSDGNDWLVVSCELYIFIDEKKTSSIIGIPQINFLLSNLYQWGLLNIRIRLMGGLGF